MNRRTCFAGFCVIFLLKTTALAQSSSVTTSDTAAASSAAATAAGSSAAAPTSVKQVLKSEWTQLMIGMIHGLFQEIRPVLGLPATPTDPTGDPLSLLESAIIGAVTASASQ